VVGLDLTTMTAVHYYLSAAPYYIRVKIFQKKKGKRTVGRVGISGQVGILRARGHAKSLVNGRFNRQTERKRKHMKGDAGQWAPKGGFAAR